MRIRFFAIILIVLLTVTVSAVYFHSVFMRQERLRLIDEHVRDTATALFESDLADIRKVDFRTIDAIISDELGEERFGKFFILRNEKGKVLYKSASANVLNLTEIPQGPQWVTTETKSQYIRTLNLKLPRIADRTLQVGIVIKQELLRTAIWSKTNLAFVLVLTTIGMIVAWVLTSSLLRPIRELERFVSRSAEDTSVYKELSHVPESIKGRSAKDDEFHRLIAGMNALVDRVNRGYRHSRIWAYQLAHELKTPLATASVQLEKAQSKQEVSPEFSTFFSQEIERMGDTISSFLNWAELENSRIDDRVHAIRIRRLLMQMQQRLEIQYPSRLQLNLEHDFYVLADPQSLDLMIQNLILNALYYSPSSESVVVSSSRHSVQIKDSGPGLPKDVLDRLGEPFNKGRYKGSQRERHGLGLAWVISVAKRYDWKVDVQSSEQGTSFTITFPESEEVIEAEIDSDLQSLARA